MAVELNVIEVSLLKIKAGFSSTLLTLVLGVFVGCGKEAEVKKGAPAVEVEPISTEVEAELRKQTVVCESGLACPANIAKVVVVSASKLKSCTGFLVNSITLATSASCLTDINDVPIESDRCPKDVHIFLPRADIRQAARLRCKEIIFSSHLNGKDATLWRSDIAYINLDTDGQETRGRRHALLSREGIEDRKTYTVWKVDAESNDVGLIRKEECQAITKSYVNPLSDSSYSPVVSLMGCRFRRGNSGAMLLGPDGRWRGIISQSLSDSLRRFLEEERRDFLIEPLSPILHASNGACLPSVIESNTPTQRECFKDLDESQVTQRRAEMLNTEAYFQETRAAIAERVNAVRPYFKWNVELVQESLSGALKVQLSPRCMNPVEDWIGRLNRRDDRFVHAMPLPDWRLSLGLDRGARFVARLNEDEEQRLFVQFSPRSAFNLNKTHVYLWKQGQNSTEFRDITVCP